MNHLSDEQLFDLVDGACAAEDQLLYKTHLAQCPYCRALYEEYCAVDAQVSAMVLERAPDGFTEKLMGAWESGEQTQVTWAYRQSKTIFLAAAMAACTLLALALYYLTVTRQIPVEVQNTASSVTNQMPGLSLNMGLLTDVFQQQWLLNGFMLLNGLLALVLFDKMVLKPFFEKKRQSMAG
jgi:predicted anti-sigma-YlaC factor YlaD